eukprot:scaffold214385_cov29-Tisochrysis_lutea.AAC.4
MRESDTATADTTIALAPQLDSKVLPSACLPPPPVTVPIKAVWSWVWVKMNIVPTMSREREVKSAMVLAQ